jgi:hypothetical protein
MMAGIQIRLDVLGDKGLQRALDRLEDRVAKKLTLKAMRVAWKPILARAKTLAAPLSARLAKLLKLKVFRGRRGSGLFGIQVVTPKKAALGIPEDAKGYWPAHQELGWKDGPARPYIRPAFDALKETALSLFGNAMAAALGREWRKR